MKSLSCILIAVLACSVKALDSRLDEHWEKFKETFGKHYSEQDEEARRLIWEGNVAEIVQHNINYDLGQHSFRKGLNEYADLSHDEFVKTLNGFKSSKLTTSSSIFFVPSNVDLPDSVDWRKQGLVTPIKNQGQCASCWAFSTTGSLEAQHKKKTGNLVSLSEQNLVDCSRPQGNTGCEGGWMTQGFDYIRKNGGIDTEQSYPYIGLDGTCHYKASSLGATITGYVNIPSGNENALQNAVATIGPVSVAIHAKQSSFHLYSGGIYYEPNCSTTELDHAVLVIGYGTENGTSYWLVKNSWGTSWGEKGYIKMIRNKNNQCGIATKASYPLV